MTKEEAISAMLDGHMVTHRFFTNDEWIRMEGNTIITEEGYRCWANEFWDYRIGASWETDWKIYDRSEN